MLTVPAIQCTECLSVVFSRCNHDFRSCSCGKSSIDGGFTSYSPRIGYEKIRPVLFFLKIKENQNLLYNDWNKRKDKFGLIETNKILTNLKTISISLLKKKSKKK